MTVNQRFPALSSISRLLNLTGWCCVAGGGAHAIYSGLLETIPAGHSFGSGNILALVVGVFGAVGGLVVVALAESIGVLFAIEENTRRATGAP